MSVYLHYRLFTMLGCLYLNIFVSLSITHVCGVMCMYINICIDVDMCVYLCV